MWHLQLRSCKRQSSVIQMKWCSLEQTYSKFVREYPRLSNVFRMIWHSQEVWRTFAMMTQKLLPFSALNYSQWFCWQWRILICDDDEGLYMIIQVWSQRNVIKHSYGANPVTISREIIGLWFQIESNRIGKLTTTFICLYIDIGYI